jgi:hypothetical protein
MRAAIVGTFGSMASEHNRRQIRSPHGRKPLPLVMPNWKKSERRSRSANDLQTTRVVVPFPLQTVSKSGPQKSLQGAAVRTGELGAVFMRQKQQTIGFWRAALATIRLAAIFHSRFPWRSGRRGCENCAASASSPSCRSDTGNSRSRRRTKRLRLLTNGSTTICRHLSEQDRG